MRMWGVWLRRGRKSDECKNPVIREAALMWPVRCEERVCQDHSYPVAEIVFRDEVRGVYDPELVALLDVLIDEVTSLAERTRPTPKQSWSPDWRAQYEARRARAGNPA